MQLNQIVLNSATKVEMQAISIEIKRSHTLNQDTRDDVKMLQQRVIKLEGLLIKLDDECRLEVIKTKETCDNLDI